MREEKEQETETERGRERTKERPGEARVPQTRREGEGEKRRNAWDRLRKKKEPARAFLQRERIRRRHGDECNDHRATKRRTREARGEIRAETALDNEIERALFTFRLLECG